MEIINAQCYFKEIFDHAKDLDRGIVLFELKRHNRLTLYLLSNTDNIHIAKTITP